MLGSDGRANVNDIIREYLGDISQASALKAVSRRIDAINEATQKNQIPMTAVLTPKDLSGTRWLQFETPDLQPPRGLTPDYDALSASKQFLRSRMAEGAPVIGVLCFNDHEFDAITKRFDIDPDSPQNQVLLGGIAYYRLGLWQGSEVILRKADQGPISGYAATSNFLANWPNLKAVISCGIGFGFNQPIGDVLIGAYSIPYIDQRVNSDDRWIPRSVSFRASPHLLNRVKEIDTTKRRHPSWPKLHFGGLLSGGFLVDNQKMRDSLKALYPGKVVGGDMEAAGIAQAAYDLYSEHLDWLAIKGVSDHGDGNKSTPDSDADQRLAAEDAALVLSVLLGDRPLYEGSWPTQEPSAPPTIVMTELDNVGYLIEHRMGSQALLELNAPPSRGSGGQDVLDALQTWATDEDSPEIFVLLGEYGMGKTVTCQAFYHQLEQARQTDPTVPLPLYFDLRKVTNLSNRVPSIDEIFEECVAKGWAVAGEGDRITPARIWKWINQGAVVIFDGLDEVLSKIDMQDGQAFADTLLSVLDIAAAQRQDTGGRRVKLMISSRTQYFRSLHAERNTLTGEQRGAKQAQRFQALSLLPLSDEQIEQYLTALLPDDVERVQRLIASTHDLSDLSERPYTLRFIAEQIPALEQRQASGEPVFAVTIYRMMAHQWLLRDSSKSHIDIDDKLDLVSSLAAHMWRKRQTSLPVKDLEAWFPEWLQARRLIWRYSSTKPEILLEDLRNSTFLSRQDRTPEASDYSFAHTSLFEFFLSEYLFQAVVDDAPQRWEMPVPSDETLDFLRQSLMEVSRPESGLYRPGLIGNLEQWAKTTSTTVNTLVLQYTLNALRAAPPLTLGTSNRTKSSSVAIPSLRSIQLAGADLHGLVFERRFHLDLSGANLANANLRDATIDSCDLSFANFLAADLWRATITGSNFTQTVLDQANLVGSTWRNSCLADVSAVDVKMESTDFISCRTVPASLQIPERVFPITKPITLCNRASGRIASFIGHLDSVHIIAWSPDGTTLATGSDDGTIIVWDPTTGTQKTTLTDNHRSVRSLAWSPDGTTLATGSDDGTIIVWDPTTGTQKTTLATGSHRSVRSLAWSPDGTTLATSSHDGTIIVWDPTTGTQKLRFPRDHTSILSTSWSPDATTLATGSYDGTITLWDPTTGTQKTTLATGSHRNVRPLAWSPDGTTLATSSHDGTITLWDPTTGTQKLRFSRDHTLIWSTSWSPDATTLAASSHDGTITLWDPTTGTPKTTLAGDRLGIVSMAWSPDGTTLATSSHDGTITLWDPTIRTPKTTLNAHHKNIWSITWSPGSTTLAIGSSDGTITLWDPTTGIPKATLAGDRRGIVSMAWSPDGTTLATSGIDNIILWDPTTGTQKTILTENHGSVRSLAWSPDGTTLATSGIDNIILWDPTTGTQKTILTENHRNIRSLGGPSRTVRSMAWSPDGSTLAADHSDTIILWDPTTGTQKNHLPRPQSGTQSMAWSPDGTTLAAGSDDGIAVWDSVTAAQVNYLPRPQCGTQSMAWSPDGTTLAAGSDDGTIVLWNPVTGTFRTALHVWYGWVRPLAWSPDGATLATGSNNVVCLWNMLKEKLEAEIELLPPWPGNPSSNYVVRNGDGTLRFVTEDAWPYLGWTIPGTDHSPLIRLPAEAFGPLPRWTPELGVHVDGDVPEILPLAG